MSEEPLASAIREHHAKKKVKFIGRDANFIPYHGAPLVFEPGQVVELPKALAEELIRNKPNKFKEA